MTTDEAFGALGTYSGGSWDQFVANEQLFGVTTSFDEAAYTTKLDRSAPDFKERERKAQQIADEINRVSCATPSPARLAFR
jgi:PAB1-binding protein PBP1